MARGRKKGGLQINKINDRDELTNMIVNQINSLNKKIKAFKNEGIDEHSEYIRQILSDDMAKFTDSGTLTKSKKFYNEKNNVWLKKTLSALHKINNHEFYGTTSKYHKEVTVQLKGVKKYAEDYLRKKGYAEDFITEVTNSKDFFIALFDAFKDNTRYGSNQLVEKVALNYGDSGLSNLEKDKILNNIEYSKSVRDRIQEEQQAFEEFKALRNGKKR
jgi:ribosomal protein S18